jgi:hypothetical protein
MAITNPLITSNTVLRNVDALNKLVKHGSSVLVRWVRGHMASRGNNEADHLAYVSAALRAAGREPFLPFSNAIIKAVALEDTLNTWTEQWHSLWNCRQYKIFLPDPQPAVSKNLLKLPYKEIGILVRAYTGFSYLGYPQSLVHPGVINPTCCLCGDAREENHHIIKSCTALATLCMATL